MKEQIEENISYDVQYHKFVSNKKQLKIKALEIINWVKSKWLNDRGLLAQTYPTSDAHLLGHLDDFIPFLLYFNEEYFVKSQIIVASKIVYQGLSVDNDRVVSYQNDEYFGGLFAYFRRTNEPGIYESIKKSIDGLNRLLIQGGFIRTFYDIRHKRYSFISSPRSGAILEVLLENSDLFPAEKERALRIIDNWIKIPFFKKYGLFPSKHYVQSPILNTIFEKWMLPLPKYIELRAGTGSFYCYKGWKGDAANLIYEMPFGKKVQTMKENTNFVFCLITAYRQTKYPHYRNAILKWVESAQKYLVKNGFVHKFWDPQKGTQTIDLDHNFALIDILCDVYYFVEKDKKYLEFAEEIAMAWINIQWAIGLFPRNPKGTSDHLDMETDFCISLWRLYELTGKTKYRNIAEKTFFAIVKYHYTENGYVLYVNQDGKPINDMIDVRFNTLLLKAFILFIEGKKIYEDDYICDLMKDR